MATDVIRGVLVAPSSPDPARLTMASFLATSSATTKWVAFIISLKHS